jgi:AraC-like DNA-binding protein
MSHFVAEFKKIHGVTPGHFAARYRRIGAIPQPAMIRLDEQ